MTTPINDFQDILDAIERNPALRDALRRHILTDELLQMPVRLERVEEDIGTIKGDVATLKEDVSTLKEGQARLEGDVATLKEGQARLESDVGTLKEGQARLESDVGTLKEDVSRIGGNVSNLMGSDYESHVAAYIHRSLRRELKINATVLSTQKNRQPLIELLDRAEGQGNITPEDNDKLNDVDIVLTVDDSDEYILGEISITVQQDDVRRATEWAAILAEATGGKVTPIAIGTREDPDLNRGGVQVLLIQQRQQT